MWQKESEVKKERKTEKTFVNKSFPTPFQKTLIGK